MRACIANGMGTVLLTVALGSSAAGLGHRPVPENKYALPVIDEAGQRVNYQRSQLANRPFSPLPKRVTGTGDPQVATSRASGTKQWSYGLFGSAIGASGIAVVGTGANAEIFVGGSNAIFGADDHWLSLHYSAATGQYQQTFYSSHYPQSVVGLASADLDGDGAAEVLVLRGDGVVEVFAALSKQHLYDIDTRVTGATQLRVKDVNSDGNPDLVVVNLADLFVIRANGTPMFTVTGAGGYDVVAAQMDDDASIEIAGTNGMVVDGSTGQVQWTRPEGFGHLLAAADTDGDGRAELIAAESWYVVWAYDVERQLPQWSIPTDLDIGAIDLADVNGDGNPELLVGDGQWGNIRIINPATQQEISRIRNPEHGVTNIAVADVDADGQSDILWGAGATSTGEDHLYVARPDTGVIVWQNIDLVGPFIGPEFGDVDGDGKQELVVASSESDAGYSSGRILVFSAGGQLRGISAPVAGNFSWTGIHDLKLRDLDGDGAEEILIAADHLYDGEIEAYGFSNGSFVRQWMNGTRPSGASFQSVDAHDVDGDGLLEIVGGGGREHTGADGVFVYVYDYATGAEEWHSPQCGSYWDKITALRLMDLDGDGNQEIAGLLDSGSLYVFDGYTRVLEATLNGAYTALGVHSTTTGDRLMLGDSAGGIGPVVVQSGIYSQGGVTRYRVGAIDGMLFLPSSVVLGSEARLSMWKKGSLLWESELGGSGYGKRFAEMDSNGFATTGLQSLDVYRSQ